MKDLIEALTIFLRYGNPHAPTHCEHDQMTICGINDKAITVEDIKRLDELGFFWSEDDECFKSFRFGSA